MSIPEPLTVYGRATSSNVQALLWGLEELGLTYTRLDYGETHGGLDTDAFRRMNPHGKIPVLTIGDTALWETGAILRYLAGACGQGAFWPADPLARAKVDMWAEWAKHEVAEAFTGPVFWEVVRRRVRDQVKIDAGLSALTSQLKLAEAVLAETPYLCGAHLTLADIQLGHVLFRYFDIDIARPPLPALERYYARLTRRAAYQKSVMVPYDVLRNTI